MNVVDLSHPISETMPVYPGGETSILRNLTNRETCGSMSFRFCSFPLRLEGGDGSPARAAALFQ